MTILRRILLRAIMPIHSYFFWQRYRRHMANRLLHLEVARHVPKPCTRPPFCG